MKNRFPDSWSIVCKVEDIEKHTLSNYEWVDYYWGPRYRIVYLPRDNALNLYDVLTKLGVVSYKNWI